MRKLIFENCSEYTMGELKNLLFMYSTSDIWKNLRSLDNLYLIKATGNLIGGTILGLVDFNKGSYKNGRKFGYINLFEIFRLYRNFGIGRAVIKELFYAFQVQSLLGKTPADQIYFWKRIGAEFEVSDKDLSEKYFKNDIPIEFKITEDSMRKAEIARNIKKSKENIIITNERADKMNVAERWYKYCLEKYDEQIDKCIKNSKIYDGRNDREKLKEIKTAKYIVEDLTTEEAIEKYASVDNKKVDVLNFASYTTPGGGFLTGARAQEESLCHHSILYPIIGSTRFEEFYTFNRDNRNNSLYTDRAIYTPDVIFMINHKEYKAGVITCASPNTCHRNDPYFLKINSESLESRINFIYKIANKERPNILILGAFGCGVFGQNPKEVATIFKKLQNKTEVPIIVFAVPKKFSVANYNTFCEVLC